ncbi:MAG: multidrug resistance efflux transporter family protein [Bacillota bacterium]|nr:multidrug resistance efflux transporter family protein [Bacillota bacterium]
MKPIILGVLAAFFFAFTFILNRMMDLAGGSWIWSASLRYFFMLPFLLIIVIVKKNLKPLLIEMKRKPLHWLLWSSVGFGLFYAPLCFSSAFAPGWLIAATWQITIVSGSLLAPIFSETIAGDKGPIKIRGKIPFKGLGFSLIILLGIVLIQIEQTASLKPIGLFFGVVPIIVASFAYPLGNRKMMDVCGGRLDTYQRVLGMTIASMPFWIVLSIVGLVTDGTPSKEQLFQSCLVAIFSGGIATILFFQATDLVRGNMSKLGAVEATQSMEVFFTLLGELLFLDSSFPPVLSWIGLLLVMGGMILHSYFSHQKPLSIVQNKPSKIELMP